MPVPASKTPAVSEAATSTPAATATKDNPKATATDLPTETALPAAGQDASSTLDSEDTNEEIVIVYKRSGGYAGLDEEFTIYANGHITAKDGREWWVEPAAVEQLQKEFESLGFFDLAPNYVPKNPCCDLFSYELSVNSGDHNAKVSTVDGAPGAPDQLWQMLDLVQNFLNQAVSG